MAVSFISSCSGIYVYLQPMDANHFFSLIHGSVVCFEHPNRNILMHCNAFLPLSEKCRHIYLGCVILYRSRLLLITSNRCYFATNPQASKWKLSVIESGRFGESHLSSEDRRSITWRSMTSPSGETSMHLPMFLQGIVFIVKMKAIAGQS